MSLQGGRALIPGMAPREKWVFLSELEKSLKVENLPLTTEEISDEISLLIVLHLSLIHISEPTRQAEI